MWCCFTANTVIEPTPKLKPLGAEVPVAVKPVTLMFRLPSEDAPAPAPVPSLLSATSTPLGAPVAEDELDAQGEEIAVLDRNSSKCENPAYIILALSMIGLIYLLMQNQISHHTDL